MASTDDLWQRVIGRWRQSGLAIRPGASSAAIQDFESRRSVVLPRDVREYLEAVDGMEPGELDDDAFRFWSLSEVKPVHEQLAEGHSDRWAYPDCFVIADWAIWAQFYAVRLTREADQPAPIFLVTGGDPPSGQAAPTFREFLARYAEDPHSLLRG